MNIRFNPPQLEDTRHAETLRRVADEMTPADFQGELRVLQSFPDEPIRLVLIASGSHPASVEVPRTWLSSELSEAELRSQLSGLLRTDLVSLASGRWCAV